MSSSRFDRHSRLSSHYVQQQPTSRMSNSPWEFENPWSHGLCNITDQCDETCYAIWCFPCFSCHLAWRMNESCWIICCLPSYLAVLRTKMRTTFRINVMSEWNSSVSSHFVSRVRTASIIVWVNVVQFVLQYKWPMNCIFDE